MGWWVGCCGRRTGATLEAGGNGGMGSAAEVGADVCSWVEDYTPAGRRGRDSQPESVCAEFQEGIRPAAREEGLIRTGPGCHFSQAAPAVPQRFVRASYAVSSHREYRW